MDTELDYDNRLLGDMIKNLLDNTYISRTSHQPPLTQANTMRPQTPHRNRGRP